MAKKDHWMQKAFNPAHKGMLHKELGIPEGQKIPQEKLLSASRRGGKLGQRARAAMTAEHIRNGGKPKSLEILRGIHELKYGKK